MPSCPGRRAFFMPRSKNALGPCFQKVGGVCLKGTGNFYAPGMPGSGPQAIRGVVMAGGQSIEILFTQCIQKKTPACPAPEGMTVTVLPSTNLTITTSAIIDDGEIIRVFFSETIQPGDEVKWSYDDTDGCLESCDGEPIGDQGPVSVTNPLTLAGDYILLESGGMSVLLLEEDDAVDPMEGYQTEDAT